MHAATIRSLSGARADRTHRSGAVAADCLGSAPEAAASSDARSVVQVRAPKRVSNAPARFRMLGVDIDNVSMEKAIGLVMTAVRGSKPCSFAFVNADCLNIAQELPAYAAVLARQDRVFADGSGVRWMARARGIRVSGNVNGTDMFPLLCGAAAAAKASVFLLGGKPEVAADAARNMVADVPELSIAGTHHGYFGPEGDDAVIAMINRSGAQILLVGLGAPLQEAWIAKHRDRLAPKVVMGVGGLFDYFSGRIARAPALLRFTGTEWIWRMAQEPRRLWRRYILGNPVFVARCLREQLSQTAGAPRSATVLTFEHMQAGTPSVTQAG